MAEEKTENQQTSNEEEEHECPECPPKGAPAWMATFADMATLLMAFFVLILSFAEFNVPKFKQISGSMKNAFGIQRVIQVVEPPKGTTILSLNFSPNPTPAVQDNLKQQTTETDQPKVELQTKQEDNTKDDGETEDAKELAKNIQEAIARGDITVEALGSKVVVNFTPTEADEKELPQLLQETLNAVESVKAASGKSESEILIGGLEKQLADLATASSQKGKNDAEGEDGENENDLIRGIHCKHKEAHIPDHLKSLYNNAVENKSQAESEQIENLIHEFTDVFSNHIKFDIYSVPSLNFFEICIIVSIGYYCN